MAKSDSLSPNLQQIKGLPLADLQAMTTRRRKNDKFLINVLEISDKSFIDFKGQIQNFMTLVQK